MTRILYVEDDEALRAVVVEYFKKMLPSLELEAVASYAAAVRVLKSRESLGMAVVDYHCPGVRDHDKPNAFGLGGLDLLTHMRVKGIKTPVIFLCNDAVEESSIDQGCYLRGLQKPDFIFRKVAMDSLVGYIKNRLGPFAPAHREPPGELGTLDSSPS